MPRSPRSNLSSTPRRLAFAAVFALAFACAAVWGGRHWFIDTFGAATMEQVTFFLHVPVAGTDHSIIIGGVFYLLTLPLLAGLGFAAALVPPRWRFLRRMPLVIRRIIRSGRRHAPWRLAASPWFWATAVAALLAVPLLPHRVPPLTLPGTRAEGGLTPCLVAARRECGLPKLPLRMANVNFRDPAAAAALRAAPKTVVPTNSLLDYRAAAENGVPFPALLLSQVPICRMYRVLKYGVRAIVTDPSFVERNPAMARYWRTRGVTVVIDAGNSAVADRLCRTLPNAYAIEREDE